MINGADRWSGLDLRHLAALEAVARTGSFARAAGDLGYTQPAVSQQIAGLERIVGQRLFERGSGPKPVRLTEAGALLLRHVEVVQARLAAARADMEALVAGSLGTLRVGTFQSVAYRILPGLVQRFTEACPGVEVRLTERDSDEDLLDLVERGELDVTYVMLPHQQGPFETTEVLVDPYMLVTPPDSELSCVADLEGVPLIGYRQCRSSSLLEDSLRTEGIEPNVVFRTDDNGTMQSFVATGIGVAVMPQLAVDVDDPRVRAVLIDALPPRRVAISWHRDRWRTPALEVFIALALEPEVARV